MTLFTFMVSILCLISLVIEKRKKQIDAGTIGKCLTLCIALGLLGASIAPKDIYDLSRHYRYIDNIRAYGFTLEEYLSYGYLYNDLNLKYTYIYNIILYIISKTLPNEALPFLAISFSYACFFYIYIDSNMPEKSSIVRFTSMSLFSVLLPFLYIYSGIRNAIAACMVALAVYLIIIKSQMIAPICLSISAMLIHPVATALIPFLILSQVKPRIWSCLAIVVFPYALLNLMEFFRLQFANDFLFRVSAKYYNYLLIRNDNQGKAFLYSTVIAISLIALTSILSAYSTNRNTDKICNLITWYALFCLGFSSSYELAVRLPYNIAALSPITVKYILDSEVTNRNLKTVQSLICLTIILLGILIFVDNILWLL